MKKNEIKNDQVDQTEGINYGYYSKVLKKPFDTLEELRKEEQEFLAAEKAKKEAAEARKADANKVEDAFKALNKAKRVYNETTAKAYATYLEKAKEIEEEYNKIISEATNSLNTQQKAYDNILKTFIDTHPEGYHLTLKDGDNVVTYTASSVNNAANQKAGVSNVMKLFYDLFNF